MKEGFYSYRQKVYYGRYDETQMCGYASLSSIKPELIQSEHSICEDDQAVRLWDNHRLLEPAFNAYGIAVMYSEETLIAWIRSNGSYADIHAGALDESHLDALGKHLGQIAWQ